MLLALILYAVNRMLPLYLIYCALMAATIAIALTAIFLK
jgi:hypothetical protein